MIRYNIDNSSQTLVLTPSTIKHVRHYRQIASNRMEAGGQLFARLNGHTITLECATGPRRADKRTSMSYIPDRAAEQREIIRMFGRNLYYVGDWHTHPQLHPVPSSVDIESIQDMFRKSRHQLASFVMLIVGTAEPPDGLFVALVNSRECYKLSPSD